MDTANVLSDDEYDVISNPGNRSLESSIDFAHEEYDLVREIPPQKAALHLFETTGWTSNQIQDYVCRGLQPKPESQSNGSRKRLIRVYVDGIFDSFDVGHALQLRQAKLAFPSVHLIVGVFSDAILQAKHSPLVRPEVERVELLRHCRWVNEILISPPWELSLTFLEEQSIDFVAIDEGTSLDPTCDMRRVKGYDELLKHGRIIKTRRTRGLASRSRTITMNTPTLPNSALSFVSPSTDPAAEPCVVGHKAESNILETS
ncbi:hypothetical protein CVT24_010118 [Panaeolus cyanescens]|uniref:choline-phosphate cytidylyltransferase n=1 Tax=Panaeolus cyanescens TaxID=181874 RepID=A0A409W9M2_9AGAR|nr:hypothetical protein CVT24_010118 [Panaeolus cyanescens]